MSNTKNTEFESYVTECWIIPTKADHDKPLFISTKDGVIARLKGYAIIPVEEYHRLMERQQQEKSRRLR